MLRFVIDEDLPRSTTKTLQQYGFTVFDVRDCGLRGKSDDEVYIFAQNNKAILTTGDLEFGNILKYPIGTHHGIIVLHFPNEVSNSEVNNQLIKALESLRSETLTGHLLIISPDKIRIRKKQVLDSIQPY